MRTGLTERLGIDVPIIQAPMNWATDARLVAAVSAAGGLGTLGPNAGAREPSTDPAVTGERLRAQIRAVRALTPRPFAVNVPIGRGGARVFSDRAVEIVLEEAVPVVIVATGSPDVYTERLKAGGAFVIHATASVKHAVKAEKAGVDAVVAEGFDGGGHSGFAEIPMAVLVPQVVDNVGIPVIAAGGISDGRGLVGALAAGAQAVYMGTRFMACEEAPIHPRVKQALVDADDTATMSWGRSTEVARTLANGFARRFREMELAGVSAAELHQFIAHYPPGPNRRVGGLVAGDMEDGEIYAGAGAGLIRSVLPAAEIVARTVREAHAVIGRLAATGSN
ncbi:nitronate monooxygenase [Alsobacter sp. SYSU M60028]|uniref:Nitronate monooxygenase n=1 Tax=Alsobacter ponti TaxID=2962936 RepID=A0ABT1LBF8_9HYPH|nr:nitronate monooxygenase [Alsobacter ponti]MCP8938769.1 nitronate monooxygenase [Alsobacter ponti]